MLQVAIAPGDPPTHIVEAVEGAGAGMAAPADAEALIWTGKGPDGLEDVLQTAPGVSWIQLPSAGIESYLPIIRRSTEERTWTCAKGIYARPVAEHALALALAGVHGISQLARARSWTKTACGDLLDTSILIVGGGGIAEALIELLAPFRAAITVVRRHPESMAGTQRVTSMTDLQDELTVADVVVLALPLTPETEGLIGSAQLGAMKRDAWLVNVGRGKLIDTGALVHALQNGSIGGAALDVTDPEPLPDGHPLWDCQNCLITPHCANPPELEAKRYGELVAENVRRRMHGEPLSGSVDPKLGY